jgi:hypothetical protein
MECPHDGFHSICGVYDRERKVLLFIWRCDRCGARLGEAAKRLEYEPLPRRDAERLPALRDRSAVGQREAYSTVTVLARLRGWSTLRPRRRAIL